MSHPVPELTDYVDGTLGPDAHARVAAHLQRCGACREEVSLATAARAVAAAVADPAPPAGLSDPAIAVATDTIGADDPIRIDRGRTAGRRWLAAAGVAAAIVTAALVLPRLGPSPTITAESGAATDVPTFTATRTVDVIDIDVAFEQLPQVAASFAASDRSTGGEAVPIAGDPLPQAAVTQHLPNALPEASACIDSAFGQTPGTPTRMIRARYQGEPAYFGIYAVGPGAGLPPERLQVLVASVRSCRPLGQSFVRL